MSVKDSHPGEPLFPIAMYIYDEAGYYKQPVMIQNVEELHSLRIKSLLGASMRHRREIRMTDPGDNMLFHADKGRVLFDGRKVPDEPTFVHPTPGAPNPYPGTGNRS